MSEEVGKSIDAASSKMSFFFSTSTILRIFFSANFKGFRHKNDEKTSSESEKSMQVW